MATPLLQGLPPFDPDLDVGASVGPRWRTWLADFETFVIANDITDDKRKRALLLYQAGSRVREIFRQLQDTGEDKDYKKAVDKLNEYFEPQKNRLYEVYKFRQAKQQEGETLDQFHTRLRSLSQTCEFADAALDFEIMMQIVVGGRSSRLRKQALRDPKITLKDLLLEGRRAEMSEFQASEIEKDSAQQHDKIQAVKAKKPAAKSFRNPGPKSKCRSCGGVFPHREKPCPAKGKTCHKCNKSNHFAKFCFSQPQVNTNKGKDGKNNVRPIQTEETSESEQSEYSYAVKSNKAKRPITYVTVQEHKFPIMIDTGSTINIIDKVTFEKMKPIQLKRTSVKAYPYNSTEPVKMQGKFETVIETKKRLATAQFYVTDHNGGCLLSGITAQDLGLITLHVNQVQQTAKQKSIKDENIAKIVKKFPKVFEGVGKLKNKQIELVIDQEVQPVAQQQRRIPFHLRDKVEKQLQQLKQQDIIERVPEDEKTDWVSPIVCVPKKNDEIRICVDMRAANRAIKRVRHPIPTVNDIGLELNGAKVFSKLDLSQAFHQLELSPQSRNITTFTTHIGLFRYKRLNYGTNSAAEIFQFTLQQALTGLKGVRNIADDVIVYGRDIKEHNEALESCLKRLADLHLALNVEKCKFLKTSLDFFGFTFCKDGKKPDPKKVEAFVNAATPTNASEVRSLLGMSNYSSQFIPDYATITEPLRALTRKNTRFEWTPECEGAYQKLKDVLTKDPVVSYFDIEKETFVIVDASPVGLSAILAQKEPGKDCPNIIAYASRALSSVEKRYSQTEKEALAIVWGIEHYHIYLYGAPFTLHTDHKPLELIYANPCSNPPARIQRWMLRLQQYNFTVVYKAGISNPADFLSRHPIQTKHFRPNVAEDYVNFVTEAAILPAFTLEEIKCATEEDKVLRGLRAAIQTGCWNCDIVNSFKNIRDEISVDHRHKILLRGTRIILPSSLQRRAIKIAHEGHQGIAKTKALLREYVWFPHLEKMVKEEIDSCIPCQAAGNPEPPAPLQTSQMPAGPWKEVKMDFLGPFHSGEYLLAVIDCYSRYPEVEIVSSTAAPAVLPKLDVIFARHGIPDKVTSDNGPPFQGKEFERYMSLLGINHVPSTPLWPQGNAHVEAFNKPLGKAIQTAHAEHRKWKQELQRFLLNYRTTPHTTTKVPPAQLLFNRVVKGKLPVLERKAKVINRHAEATRNDEERKQSAKIYADSKRRAKHSEIQIGDTVICQQKKQNKLSTRFNPVPYTVIKSKGTRITARNNNKFITRNVSFFKKLSDKTVVEESDDDLSPMLNDQMNSQQTVAMPRRSTRNRKQTERYGDSIDSSLIR